MAIVLTLGQVFTSSSQLGCLLVLPLIAALATLLPLAHASPPDPSWIAGLYDDADHDDAVFAITEAPGFPGINGFDDPPAALSSDVVVFVPSTRPADPSRIRLVDRSPPLS